MKIVNILGINVSNIKRNELETKIHEFINNNSLDYIVTPNPEFLLAAKEDEEFFYILNKANLAIPDGVGLWFAGLTKGKCLKRFTGADLVIQILKLAEYESKKVAIFNWKNSLSTVEDIKLAIKNKFPKLEFIVEEIEREWSMPYYKQVNLFEPDIALITLGAPWQEKFIFHHLFELSFIRLAVGVGGSFDYLTGKIKSSKNQNKLKDINKELAH
ncbi:WecB/TagA/CpsF family glycosyltransferase, partial [Patescibacteria group bacterium]